MKNKFLLSIFSLLFITVNAQAFELCGEIRQGEFVIGKAKDAKKVSLNENE